MSLEGQTFQFNMGAADPIPTKMDVSLDDMIKAVSIRPAHLLRLRLLSTT